MEIKGVRHCAICEDRCYESQVKEKVRSRVPKIKTIYICLECYDEWRTEPEYEHLRPDYSKKEADEIKRKREHIQRNWIP